MKYLKVWTNFFEVIEPLKDDEAGRLFRMMLAYAESGKEPETFGGNERFLWPAAKQQIDLAAAKNEILRQNGSRGGRPKADETKENQTEPNETKANQSKAYKEKKRKEKICIKDDDDDSARAEDEYQEAVRRAYREYVGRSPTPEEERTISVSARMLGHSPQMLEEAVRISAGAGANSMAAYSKQVMSDWNSEEIRTPEELGEYQILYALSDADGMREAKARRLAAHAG